MITHEKATDKNIITKQVVINTPTSARLLPITADEKVIDEIQQALNELECLKKQEKLLELYKEYFKYSEMLKDGRKFGGRMLVEHERDKIIEEIKELENDNTWNGFNYWIYKGE